SFFLVFSFFSFFLHRSLPLPLLHSFPTRRSSDLFLVHDDAGGFRLLNWMILPTVVEEEAGLLVVRKRVGKTEDRLEVRLLEVVSDRKSTRLNSSHRTISYAVFCLKKKKNKIKTLA